MSNVINMTPAPSYKKLAVEKIAAELKSFKGDRYGMAVKNHVASTLTHFCEQDERFAEVVYKTKRTLSDCCAAIMKGCGQSISDIDVYRGAVRHYFPNADIDFHMTISLKGEAPSEEEMSRVPEQKPAGKAEKKTEGKDSTKTEKASKAVSKPSKPAPVAPVEKPAASKPAPAPKPTADKKEALPKKKAKGAYEDPNVIQLALF